MRRRISLLSARVLFLAMVCAVAGTFGVTVLAHESDRWSGEPHVVLVHPLARGKWTATTIQAGIDMVAPGGWVFVFPATYAEVLNVTKGVSIDGIGGNIWPVIVAPPGQPASVIEIATTDPVTLRGLTVHVPGPNGIRGLGEVDLTVERSTVLAVNPPTPIGQGNTLIAVGNNSLDGSRARMVVRHSSLDGAIPNPPFTQSFGLVMQGDVDAVFERNVIRRVGGACILVLTHTDLSGETNADILDNDLDECHPVRPRCLDPRRPDRRESPVPDAAAHGHRDRQHHRQHDPQQQRRMPQQRDCVRRCTRDESNGTGSLDVVKPCATPSPRNLPSAIWIGRLTPVFPFPPVDPTVRFNDITGNALRRSSGRAEPDDRDRRVVQLLGIAVGPVGYRRWRRRRDSRRTRRRRSRIHAVRQGADCPAPG